MRRECPHVTRFAKVPPRPPMNVRVRRDGYLYFNVNGYDYRVLIDSTPPKVDYQSLIGAQPLWLPEHSRAVLEIAAEWQERAKEIHAWLR